MEKNSPKSNVKSTTKNNVKTNVKKEPKTVKKSSVKKNVTKVAKTIKNNDDMKNNFILLIIIIIALIGCFVLFAILNKDKKEESKVPTEINGIDVSEIISERPGIYTFDQNDKIYALSVYKNETDQILQIRNLKIQVLSLDNEVLFEANSVTNDDVLSPGEIGYFLAELVLDEHEMVQLQWKVESSNIATENDYIETYEVNGIDISNVIANMDTIGFNGSGVMVVKYTNDTKEVVEYTKCMVDLFNGDDELLETVVLEPEKTTINVGESVYFVGISDVMANRLSELLAEDGTNFRIGDPYFE